MSESDFVAEPWRLPSWRKPTPTAIVPKPAAAPPPLPAPAVSDASLVPEQPNPKKDAFPQPTALDPITKAIDDRTDSLTIERLARKKGITLTTTQPKNPKMRGLIDSMSKFNHQVDCDIDDASKLIISANARRTEVFTKVRDHVSAKVGDLGDMLQNFDDLESAIGDNGAPSSDGGSQGSQVASAISTDGKAVP